MATDNTADQVAIIDGANVAHATEAGSARLGNILLVREHLREQGYEPIVLVDAALRHRIDAPEEYERLVEQGGIRQAPAGTDADWFILSFARELGASVVSNDRFQDRQDAFPEVMDRLIRFMIVEDEVVLERRAHRR